MLRASTLALLASLTWLSADPALAQRVPRAVDTSPGSCDGFLDYASETLATNFQIVSQTDVGGGVEEVEISAQLENLEATALHSASLTPHFSLTDLGVLMESVLPAEFPILAQGALVPSTNTLVFRAPAANVAEILARLNAGTIPVSVHADEAPVEQPGVAIAEWTATEDGAYAFARDAFAPSVNLDPGPPPYEPGAMYTAVFLAFGDGVPSVLDQAASHERFYLIPDPSDPPSQIPEAMHHVRVLDVDRSDEDDESSPESQDGVTVWTATLQRTESEPLPAIYASASFCTGTDAFVDRPVESTRLFAIDRDEPSDESRDSNVLPIRFDVAPIPAPEVEISGQIQGYALRPSLELRVRPSGVRVAANVDTDLSFTAQAMAKSGAEVAMEDLSLWSLCFPLADLSAGPVPIGLNLQMEHLLNVSGSFEAGAVVGFSKSFEGGHTVGYDSRLAEPYFRESRHVPHPVAFTPPQLTEETGVHAEIATDVVTTLRVGARYPICDTGAGFFLDARAYGSLDVLPLQDPWWTLAHGVELGAGIDFQILGFDVAQHTFDPIEIVGGETRSSTLPPLELNARGAAPAEPRREGEDQRWAVAIDDVDVSLEASATAIAATSDGGALVIGTEPTGRNFMTRLDRFGAWQETFRYALGFQPRRVLTLPDDSFLVAGRNDTFLAKHAPDGTEIWAFRYALGDANDTFARCQVQDAALVPEAAGAYGVIVVGTIGRALITENDACAFRVDANGNLLWARMYLDARRQDLLGVATLANGDFAAVGYTHWPVGTGIVYTPTPLILRLDGDDGSLLWAKALPTERSDHLNAVAEAPDGTLVAVGGGLRIIWETGNALVARIDADGGDARHGLLTQDEAWESLLDFESFVDTQGGDTPYDELFDIAPAPGGFVVTGKTSLADDQAPWAAKVNTELSVEWFTTFDGTDADVLDAVVPTPDGFLASGSSESLDGVGQSASGRWAWALKLPFEGMVRLAPETAITSRYLEPGLRGSSSDPAIVPDGVISADAPLAAPAADVVSISAETNVFTTPQEICVRRLTESGRQSTLDGCADDLDEDWVYDDADNCVGTANASQLDGDGDGFGNFCDADLDQSGVVDAADYTIWRDGFGLAEGDPGFPSAGDLDGNGSIDLGDFALLRAMQGAAPGDPVSLWSAPRIGDEVIVTIVFPETGTNEISVEAGATVTARLWIRPGDAGISAYAARVIQDGKLTADEYLEFISAGMELTLDPLDENPGPACDAATFGAGVFGPPFLACELTVQVASDAVPGDIEVAPSPDGIRSGTGADLTALAVLVPGTIHVVPEADAFAAGGAALAALAGARRRRLRQATRVTAG